MTPPETPPHSRARFPWFTPRWPGVLWLVVLSLGHQVPLLAQSGETKRNARTEIPAWNRNATAPDLILDRKGEQKAEALAAYAEGVAAEDNADTERALAAYRRALALDPSNTELAVKIGYELARRDQIPEGIDILKDAAKAAPKDPLPPLCLAQIYGKFLNKPDLAERYAKAGLALAPDNFAAYLTLFDHYATTGQRKKADQVLDRAFRAKADNPDFWLQLAEVTIRLARRENDTIPEETRKRLEPVFAKMKLEAGEKKEAAGSPRSRVERLMKAGDLYGMMNDSANAITYYQRALELHAVMEADERDAVRHKLARLLLGEKRSDEAITVLEALIKDSPTRYDTYEMLGELYEARGQMDRATASYEQALLVDSTQPARFLKVAEMQLRQGKAAGAVKTLTLARSRFPGIPRITYSLAIALTEAKELQRAVTVFAQALFEAQERDHTLLDSAFYFRYGATAEQAGDLETAARMLRKSIELNPASAAEAYNYLGYMWADKGVHLPEAMELIKRALALDPDNGAYLDSLGWCHYRLGNHQEALTFLQKAAERLEPEDAVVFDHLGDVYQALGKREEALANWNKALTLDPSNATIRKKVETPGPKATTPPPSPTPAATPTPAVAP